MTLSFYNLYPKLDPIWKKQANRRTHMDATFTEYGKIHNDVANIMCKTFNELHEKNNLLRTFQNQSFIVQSQLFEFHDSAMFIYESNSYDHLPKSNHMKYLNEFISNIVLPLFTRTEQSYLKKYFNFTSCFFVWFLCTPQFFYANKSKIWDCCLLQKRRIIHNQNPSKQTKNKIKTISYGEDTIIPALEKSVQEKLSNMASLLNLSFEETVSSFEIHARITREMTEENLGKNKYKKGLKLYQAYEKEHKKLVSLKNITYFKKNESGIHRSNGTFVPFKQKKIVPTEIKPTLFENHGPEEEEEEENDVPDDWESLIV